MKLTRFLLPTFYLLLCTARGADIPTIDANGNLQPPHGGPAHDKAITLPSDVKISGQSTGIQAQITANGTAISTEASRATAAEGANTTAINARVVITANLSSLRALGAQANGVQVAMAGYTTPGDGGGGLFYYDTSSTATDNIGTIVQPTGVSGAGRFIRSVGDNGYNVRWFGATGDGATDDTTTVANTIAAAGSGRVYAPPGRYKITRANTSDNINADNVEITGAGPSTVFVSGVNYSGFADSDKRGNEHYNIFQATGRKNITISNVAFENAALISASSCSNVTVRNVYGSGSHDGTLHDKALYFYKCAGVRIDNPFLTDFNDHIYLSGDRTAHTTGVSITGGKLENDVAAGAFAYADFPVGIYVYFAEASINGVNIRNIYSDVDNGTTGTGMGYSIYEGDGACNALTINGCPINYDGNGNKRAIAIMITRARQRTVTGNTITASSTANMVVGIRLQAVSEQDALGAAVATQSDSIVTGNTIKSAQTSPSTGIFGIYWSANSAQDYINDATITLNGNLISGFTNGVRVDGIGIEHLSIDGGQIHDTIGDGIAMSATDNHTIKSPSISGVHIFRTGGNGIHLISYIVRTKLANLVIEDGNLVNASGDNGAAVLFQGFSFGSRIVDVAIRNNPGVGKFTEGVANASNASSRILKDITRNVTFTGFNANNVQFVRFPAASPTTQIWDAEYGDVIENVTVNAGGTTGWKCTNATQPTLAADVTTGSTTVTFSSTSGMAVGDLLVFTLTNNPLDHDYSVSTNWFATSIASVTDGTHVVVANTPNNTYPAASAMAVRRVFKTLPQIPLNPGNTITDAAQAANTFFGNFTGSSASPTFGTVSQVKGSLALAQADITGLTTSSSPAFAGETISNTTATSRAVMNLTNDVGTAWLALHGSNSSASWGGSFVDHALLISRADATNSGAGLVGYKDVILATNGFNVRWKVDNTGNFLANTDNTFDIGAIGSTRPRNVYVGTNVVVNSTVTAAGTTGAQTINKARGTVRFAAGASSVVVTDSLVSSTSKVVARPVGAFDSTATNFTCTAASGSFTITANAAATAETEVVFDLVIP